MAYTPTEWQCGDVVTAEKLNKLENGLADCCGGGTEPFEVIFTYDENIGEGEWACNKTYAEILTARQNGEVINAYRSDSSDFCIATNVTFGYDMQEDADAAFFGFVSYDNGNNLLFYMSMGIAATGGISVTTRSITIT